MQQPIREEVQDIINKLKVRKTKGIDRLDMNIITKITKTMIHKLKPL